MDPSRVQNLHHYPLEGKSAQVDQVVRDYGFQSHAHGGRQGRPDLDCKNYDTKWLPVPDAQSSNPAVEEHVNSWRKLHELAHALTEPDVDAVYGPGKRVGMLGQHRTQNDAMRAVHWEWLAAHKQRELIHSMGIQIPDETFNKELNTVMHDGVHRALTGNVVDPSTQGFAPHSHQIPLETALGMVKEGAHQMGLQGMHDLVKSEYTLSELRSMLAEKIKGVLKKHGF